MNYRIESVRRRLVLAAVLMVVAYCLYWAGLLSLTSNAARSIAILTMTAYEWESAEGVMVAHTQVAQTQWMDILTLSSILYAAGFAACSLLVWKLLPSRASCGLVAVGMFATFSYALPFVPGSLAVASVHEKGISDLMAPSSRKEAERSALLPMDGGIPWVDMRAFAQEPSSAGSAASVDAAIGRGKSDPESSPMLVAFDGMRMLSAFASFAGLLVGIAFWSTVLGLVVAAIVPSRFGRVGPAPV